MGDPHTEMLRGARRRALRGNLERGGDKLTSQNKLFVRDRIDRLCDPGTFVEDQLLANAAYREEMDPDLPADGVVTGVGEVDGRPVCIMANDPTVKAGSWGARTVEKIVRLTETALRDEVPGGLAGGLGGGPHHRPGGAVPRPAGGRAHLLQPGPPLGSGAPGVLPVRTIGRRWAPTSRASATWSSWSRGTPRCTWDRPAWPRWSSGSRPRWRRWGEPACTPPSRVAATTWRSTTRMRSNRRASTCPTCPVAGGRIRPATRPIHRFGASTTRSCRRRSLRATTCTRCSTAFSTPTRCSRSSRCSHRS